MTYPLPHQQPPGTFYESAIVTPKLTYLFSRPLKFQCLAVGHGWVYLCEELNMHCSNKTQYLAWLDLVDEFVTIYNEYAKENDDNLAPSGKELKNKLLTLVKKVDKTENWDTND